MHIPEIKEYNGKKVLYVDGKPFFMISGEIHNSSSSSIEYLQPILQKLENLGLNSVLLPISWQMIEPEEDCFEFKLVDKIIDCCEKYHLKIGLLWFGSYKNAACSYAPQWVKKDIIRFPRAQLEKGKNQIIRKTVVMDMPFTTLSPFGENTMKADGKAFAMLMRHIREVDSHQTVITVQVENETGYLGGDFDYSDIAIQKYKEKVPTALRKELLEREVFLDKKLKGKLELDGTWEEVFGKHAHEVFTAFYISKFVDYIAECGKKEYPLPFGVNCWLDSKGSRPGKYPCGGPISSMMEIWMFNAKHIDYYCPDNYLYEFFDICDRFGKYNNPAYVPESPVCSLMVARQLYILGHYHGMCYAGFGIEDIDHPPKVDLSRFAWLVGFSVDNHKKYPQYIEMYTKVNHLLSGAMDTLMKYYGTEELDCFVKERNRRKALCAKDFGPVRFETIFVPFGKCKDSATLICQIKEGEYLILGYGTISRFKSLDKEKPYMEFLSIEEGYYRDGTWNTVRILNGDEEQIIQLKPSLLKVKIHRYC